MSNKFIGEESVDEECVADKSVGQDSVGEKLWVRSICVRRTIICVVKK